MKNPFFIELIQPLTEREAESDKAIQILDDYDHGNGKIS